MYKPSFWVSWGFGWLFALLFALLLAVPLATQAAPAALTVLHEGQTSVRIGSGVELLVEEAGKPLTAEQAMGAANWRLYEGRKVNLSRQRTAVWLRFRVENQATRNNWALGIDWPLLERIRFQQYDARTGRLIATHDSGLLASPDRKLLDTGYAFPLPLAQGSEATVLLRLFTTSAMIVPLTIWDRDSYQMSRNVHNLGMGVLFGILGIMLLYNASLFVFTRDRSYAYYSAYLLAATLYELAVTGYGPLLLWGDSPWLAVRGYELSASLTFLTVTLFFRVFLDIRNCGVAHLWWTNNLFAAYWVGAVSLVIFRPSPWLSLSIGLMGVVAGFFAIYGSVVLIRRGNISARYFALGWAVLMLGTLAHILSLFSVIEGNWFTDYGQHVGFVLEIALLSIALADRIKRDRLARERAQHEALQLTRNVQLEREQKIQAQDEAIAIQRRANEQLEVRVLDRTAELERAMKNLEIANVELAKLSVTDALTKVHNRRYFDEMLACEHDRSARTGVPLALLLADIDHFKKINDTCGHLAGDECLRLVAATMAQTVGRSTDLVARYGGEEFALVLPSTGPEQAFEVAERVRLAVEGITFIHRGKRVPISISLGVVARATKPHQQVPDFIAEADEALYRAKEAGRNRVMLAA